MKYESARRLYICQRCGLALKRDDLDKMWEQQRDTVREEQEKQYEGERRRKDYLNWWLSKEK
jgi:hypothetical protein